MKILVYPHDLAMGGSQINAIDLAAEMQEQGHEVIVYGVEGPLTDYVAQKRLRFLPAHAMAARPSPTRIAQLARLCRAEGIDIVQAYEWPPCLDAYFGAHILFGIPLVCTVLSMTVSPLVPPTVPLFMGTKDLVEQAVRERRGMGAEVGLLEPPIDVQSDSPSVAGLDYRKSLGIADDELTIVSVSRLSFDLKFDALTDAIGAAEELGRKYPIRLVVVGGGDAEHEIRRRSAAVNQRIGREVILTPGPTLDPRSAYDSADVVVAMGSSALRAMAHEKPVIVQGEHGWSLPCTADTIETFLAQGFYGVGNGESGSVELAAQLEMLLEDEALRREVGQWGRTIVVDRFSLQHAASRLLDRYSELISAPRPARRTAQATAFLQTSYRAGLNELKYHLPTFATKKGTAPLKSEHQIGRF